MTGPTGSPVEDIAYLTRSEHRVATLLDLAVRSRIRSELREAAGVSSSTIRLTFREFDEPGGSDLYSAPHGLLGIVVGDPACDDVDDTFGTEGRPPVSRPALDSIAGVDASQWVFPVPAETVANDAMSVSTIVDDGPGTSADR